MDIKYLTLLNNNPSIQEIKGGFVKTLQPITITEINNLEQTYNGRNPFPVALRELLFLAGKYCYVLDFGLFESQAAMQEKSRSWLKQSKHDIDRPFFVIDVYNASEQFLFVYLDEDLNDPVVYEAFLPVKNGVDFIESLNQSLSEYISAGLKKILNGENPF
ncbi:hypothetical protein FO440_18990 [Mucilaginibacter corticis]|uniref:SMI1/KNR4 family protein n=1 Tax=Mucilaginibacter corticis TaxID=2597670 RepID=A0A556MFK8_9SPHI|nr:hypothetical protein [Mucilaginibacter corticis]TSJ38602.1 hypothetical protein FO440_18990 [Mucilaginibacter corticis]